MAGARSAAEVPVLRGRRDERGVLDKLLDAAQAGRSGVLVLRGEAGIGKTALLGHAIESASDGTLLRAVGVESEMELPFATLHQLRAPIRDFVDRLPAPQRDALEIIFGVSAGAPPDRFLVALATLSLFSEAAQERPLLCVIDDAQWLDRASAQALGFVARRLLAEPVALLVAARETTDAFADLPELLIERLDDAEARKLLASVIPGRLDDRVTDQLVAEARGDHPHLTAFALGAIVFGTLMGIVWSAWASRGATTRASMAALTLVMFLVGAGGTWTSSRPRTTT
ncbi:MAG TPA: ATP-binding protein [Thermoleophilaceae bacterium]|jgi:hypothetical protein|nr:ATP-binding protein [Thermoleophilaceae bacterium]